MNKEELKPCPFCGKDAKQEVVRDHEGIPTGDMWTGCDCKGAISEPGPYEECVKQWNTRPIEDGLRGEIKTLKEWPRCHIHDCDMHKTTASEQPWICPECELRGELETANTLLVECANRLVKTDETVEDKFIGRLITHTARFLKADSIAHREGEVK